MRSLSKSYLPEREHRRQVLLRGPAGGNPEEKAKTTKEEKDTFAWKGKNSEKGKSYGGGNGGGYFSGGGQYSYSQNFHQSGKGKDKEKPSDKGKGKNKSKQETRSCHNCGKSTFLEAAIEFDSEKFVHTVRFFIGDECEAAVVPECALKVAEEFYERLYFPELKDNEEFYEHLYFLEKETAAKLESEFAENHGCGVVEWLSSYEIAEPKHVRAVKQAVTSLGRLRFQADVGVVQREGAGVGGGVPMAQAEGGQAAGVELAAQVEPPEVPVRQELMVEKDCVEIGGIKLEVDMPQTPVPRAVRPAKVIAEFAAKRPRLETRQIAGEEFVRMDETKEVKYDFQDDYDEFWGSEHFEQFQVEEKNESNKLWFPTTSDQPQLSENQIAELDNLADMMVEIERLEKMGVIARPDKVDQPVGSKLSAKVV
eukprot:Skav232101  [mRNA]  locus=scaffold2353:107943:111510:+ [translate_table: standard]